MMLLWFIRFLIFDLYESPKYLMGRGRDAEAVEVVHKVAAYNGVKSNLTLEQLEKVGLIEGHHGDEEMALAAIDTSAFAAVRRKLSQFSGNHVKSLFATKKLAWSTTLLIILWAFIGLAFPLYVLSVIWFLFPTNIASGITLL